MKATVLKTGETVNVKQTDPGSEFFITESKDVYNIKELSFDAPYEMVETEKFMDMIETEKSVDSLTNLMSNQMKAQIKYETYISTLKSSDFWRELRGDIVIEMIKISQPPINVNDICTIADDFINKMVDDHYNLMHDKE